MPRPTTPAGAQYGRHGAQLRCALAIRDVTISQAAHPVDGERHQALEDEGKQQNQDYLWCVVPDKIDDVRVPTAAKFPEVFVLWRHGDRI